MAANKSAGSCDGPGLVNGAWLMAARCRALSLWRSRVLRLTHSRVLGLRLRGARLCLALLNTVAPGVPERFLLFCLNLKILL